MPVVYKTNHSEKNKKKLNKKIENESKKTKNIEARNSLIKYKKEKQLSSQENIKKKRIN